MHGTLQSIIKNINPSEIQQLSSQLKKICLLETFSKGSRYIYLLMSHLLWSSKGFTSIIYSCSSYVRISKETQQIFETETVIDSNLKLCCRDNLVSCYSALNQFNAFFWISFFLSFFFLIVQWNHSGLPLNCLRTIQKTLTLFFLVAAHLLTWFPITYLNTLSFS